jgi:Xaa-Pro aminopeptidase
MSQQQLSRIRSILGKCDALLVTSKDVNLRYILGQQVDDAVLIVPKKGIPLLILSPLEKVVIPGVKVVSLKDFDKTVAQLKARVIGMNEPVISASLYKKVAKGRKTVDLHDQLEYLRSIKSEDEMLKIRRACMITCDIFKDTIEKLKKHSFAMEGDVSKYLKLRTLEYGCELAFEPIVASGKDSAVPHYAGNKKLAKGFLILDFGVKFQGYCSDVSRTVFLGVPSHQDVFFYQKVLQVQEETIKFVIAGMNKQGMGDSSGIKASTVHEFALKSFGADQKYFIHGIGHGVGLLIHEHPGFAKKLNHTLRRGMVITVEPGMYTKQGVRIEDDVFLGKKVEVLTARLAKKLVCI